MLWPDSWHDMRLFLRLILLIPTFNQTVYTVHRPLKLRRLYNYDTVLTYYASLKYTWLLVHFPGIRQYCLRDLDLWPCRCASVQSVVFYGYNVITTGTKFKDCIQRQSLHYSRHILCLCLTLLWDLVILSDLELTLGMDLNVLQQVTRYQSCNFLRYFVLEL